MAEPDPEHERSYTARIVAILWRMLQTQSPALDRLAGHCADALARDNLVHLFGSGHSVLPVLDAFPRYGSFVGLHPLTDPRLMWHNVLGPGGVRELQWLERAENYLGTYLRYQPLTAGDVLVCFSHGGTTAAAVEAAVYARERGVTTAAVTALAAAARPATHSSGKRLADVCDVVIDTCAPVEDAIVPVPGWQRPTGGSASVAACVVVHEIITRTAALAAARGMVLPTFVSPTLPGIDLTANDEVFASHRRYLHAAEERALRAAPGTR